MFNSCRWPSSLIIILRIGALAARLSTVVTIYASKNNLELRPPLSTTPHSPRSKASADKFQSACAGGRLHALELNCGYSMYLRRTSSSALPSLLLLTLRQAKPVQIMIGCTRAHGRL